MSTDDPTHSPGHPDFEALSAHVDGEAPEVASHVAGCAECRMKLKWLRTAIAVVATPVPPVAPSVREQALARAGEAFESRPQAVKDHGDVVVPVAAGARTVRAPSPSLPPSRPASPPAPIPIDAGRRRRERSGSGLWVGLGSAAAVVVAVVIGVGALGGGGGSQDTTDTFAAGPVPEQTTNGSGGAVVGAGTADASTADARTSGAVGGADDGDLGEIGDAATLAARARPVLTERQTSLASSESAPAAGLTVGQDSSAAPPVTPKVVGTRPCEMEVRAARPGLGTVVYYATGQVEGVPVVVLGFEPGLPPAAVTLLALAQQEGCRVVLEAAGP